MRKNENLISLDNFRILENGHGRIIFSDDSRSMLACTAGRESGLGLWDAATGKALGQVTLSRDDIRDYTLVPSNSRIALLRKDNTIQYQDTVTLQETLMITSPIEKTQSIAFSPDGKRVLLKFLYFL